VTTTTPAVATVPASGADDPAFVTDVVDLVNRVYVDAERGLWNAGAQRTDPDDIATIIRAGGLVTAHLDGQVVGTIDIHRLEPDLGQFGMLTTAPEHRSLGIGRHLVAFAEQHFRDQSCTRMQLELLVPRAWTHPNKVFLRDWYTRLGYRPIRTTTLGESYPQLEARLATPCDLVIYHKPL
jgi:GNAT superfamily N-acetyltransferase